ncbi:MAG: YHS domain-containing protein [Ignavibacteriae bacterium]|nr:YHS domain-containing protein [Ignavibacteriota bacterium]NOG99762.1 YHS domain-containing protein [Ignavibacteriota bacterium]
MDSKKRKHIDPVCLMEVEIPETDDLDLKSATYEGNRYYFCSPFCAAAFINSPSRFIDRLKKLNNNKNK